MGRTVTGLDVTSEEFGISPCYFDFSKIKDEEERNRAKADIKKIVHDLMGSGNVLEAPVYILCQFLYASLSYHYSFLQRTLDPTDRLRQSTIFQAVTAKHQELASVSYPWNWKPG